MMSDEKPSYKELKSSLADAERTLRAIRNEQVDALIGKNGVYLLRLREVEEALKKVMEELEIRVQERTQALTASNMELLHRTAQLAKLAAQLTLVEQRERKRIAGILHDDLQQLLVGIKMGVEVLSNRIIAEQKPEALRIIDLVAKSIQVSRSLTAELSPPSLQQGGLNAALEWLARWMKENHDLTVELRTLPDIDPEREDLNVLLFQSIRELLFNVVKHAGVKAACIEMKRDESDRLCVAVIDQGVGFVQETIWDKAQEGIGFGLFSIRERLMLLGGTLEVESAPGSGASFTLIVPLGITREKRYEERIEQAPGEFIEKTSENKIRVLLTDDHTVVCRGLSAMLNQHSDIEAIGEALNGEAAVRMSRELKPDVILMDISMPNMNGLKATRIIHSEFPHIRIIGLSMHDAEGRAAILEAGASAYCAKDGDTDTLLSAIRGKVEGFFC